MAESPISTLALIISLLTPIGGALVWILSYRTRKQQEEAKVKISEAEAKKIMAEAEKTLKEADGEEAQSLAQVIGAWKTLFETTSAELVEVRTEQARARQEHNRVLAELRRYKHGVEVLIGQLRRLGVDPLWTPDNGERQE